MSCSIKGDAFLSPSFFSTTNKQCLYNGAKTKRLKDKKCDNLYSSEYLFSMADFPTN